MVTAVECYLGFGPSKQTGREARPSSPTLRMERAVGLQGAECLVEGHTLCK